MWFNIAGAIVTFAMGCLGLFSPVRAAQVTGLQAVTPSGRAEFRATFGGFFVLLGLALLVTGNAHMFLVVGLAWLGAALGRLVSIIVDDGGDRRNWGAVGFETAIAVCLLAGDPFQILAEGIA